MRSVTIILSLALLGALNAVSFADSSATLTPGMTIALTGGAAKFDYMMPDGGTDRIFASHPGAQSLVLLNLKESTATQINLGAEVNGVAVDPQDNKVFAAGGGGKLFVFNRQNMKQEDVVALPGHGDDILFDAENDTLYVDNDDTPHVWAFDAKTDKLVATIDIDGAPEYMQYDPATKHLFQNIKTDDEVQVIDTTTNKVIAAWPTAPETAPHGLAFDPQSNRLYSAGTNKIMAILDASTGKVVGTAALASSVDQIAFDPKLRRIYCAGHGFLTTLSLAPDGSVASDSSMTIPSGVHTIAVDPNTDHVWVSYPDKTTGASYLAEFIPIDTAIPSN